MVNLSRMQMLIGCERRLKNRYRRKLADATRITSSITGMPRASGNHSKVEEGAIDLAELEEAYREVFNDLSVMRTELDKLLPSLDDQDDIGIMRLRYIEGHIPEEIPDIVCLSRRAMFYHLSGAERKLIQMFPDKVTR